MTRTMPFEAADRHSKDTLVWLMLCALTVVFFGFASVRLIESLGGYRVSDNYKTDAYGVELATSGVTSNAYRFAGEEFDFDLNQVVLRARNFDSNTGRFFTLDSVEGDSSDPASLHLYAYCRENPGSYTDYSGYTPLSLFVVQLLLDGYQATSRLYGSRAHKLIQADVVGRYPGVRAEVAIPGGRIDLAEIDFAKGIAFVYEIKPIGGSVDPQLQLDRYIKGLKIQGFNAMRGLTKFSGDVVGPFVVDRIRYGWVSPGVVEYEPYREQSPRRVLVAIGSIAVVGISVLLSMIQSFPVLAARAI